MCVCMYMCVVLIVFKIYSFDIKILLLILKFSNRFIKQKLLIILYRFFVPLFSFIFF